MKGRIALYLDYCLSTFFVCCDAKLLATLEQHLDADSHGPKFIKLMIRSVHHSWTGSEWQRKHVESCFGRTKPGLPYEWKESATTRDQLTTPASQIISRSPPQPMASLAELPGMQSPQVQHTETSATKGVCIAVSC